MKLLELQIKNFKGIKDFTFSPEGKNANIYGDNETGKTTVFDAFMWLFFGKDSNYRAASGHSDIFIIKPISDNGNEGTEHEVYAKLKIDDDKTIELKRIHKEKFNRNGDLLGSTTQYFLNGIPDVKEMDYKEFIRSLIDEKKFKCLIDPIYFSEKLSKQERRAIIFDIFVTMTDQEIIDNNKELSEINDFLSGHKISDYKKIIKDKEKQIKKAKDEIPTRLDEAKKALIDIDESKKEEIKKTVSSNKNKLKEIIDKKLLLENDKGTINKKAELAEIRQKISKFIQDYENKVDEKTREKQKNLLALEEKHGDLCLTETKKEQTYKTIDNEINDIEAKIISLRQAWSDENIKNFEYEKNILCPTCGQSLPEEKIHEAYNKALEQFNKEKSEKLESIQNDGKKLRASVDILSKDREKLEKEITSIKNEKEEVNKKAINIEKQISSIKGKKDKYTREKEFLSLAKKEIKLNAEINKLSHGDNKEEICKTVKEIDKTVDIIDMLENDLLKIAQNETQKTRIKALEEEGKTLSKEQLKLKKQLSLLDEFTRIKVKMTEELINEKFKLAKFKLFHQLVNGELEDCCEVTDKKGVPFITNLNNGARINTGLDIINVLSYYYGIALPIFIDNAEGVTNIIKTKGQQVRLYVQANQKKLKVLVE